MTDTATHEHHSDTEDGDECDTCGEIFCPDTHTTVDYDDITGNYWHRDGSVCFLHQASQQQ